MVGLEDRVERLVGSRPVAWERRAAAWQPPAGVPGGNERFSVVLGDGRRVFVKHATSDDMAHWLRREQQVYAHLSGSFMPQLLGWDDEGSPLLVLEDLTDADWPPPWTDFHIDAVLDALAEIRSSTPPPDTPSVVDYVDLRDRWARVAADPEPFLSLRLVTRDWLGEALPVLLEASRTAPLEGDELLHCDVRSDNLCVRDGRAILFDWNHACLGDARVDLAFWLPSLAAEGGPQPHDLLPDAGSLTAVVAGFFAAAAGLPPPEFAPTVRALQVAQLVPALAWMRRELDL